LAPNAADLSLETLGGERPPGAQSAAMTEIEKEELEAGARAAVLVRRSDLPVPLAHAARSFFGGLPKLPPEFDWPRAEVRACDEVESVALTFVAQIDLTELPNFDVRPLLPQTGILYFFCSSVFEGEGSPPCQVFYYPTNADSLPEREPPPDLMPLAGNGGDYQVKWLDPTTDFHSRVEFKYPISFLPFRDFEFQNDPVGGALLVGALCEALGPGDPKETDLLLHRRADDYAKDENWPFNWLLITLVVRSVLSHVRHDVVRSPYRTPLDDEARKTLQDIEADANGWLERSGRLPPLESVDDNAKEAFRAWWADVVLKYGKMRGQVSVSPYQFPRDLGHAINHTIRHVAAHDERALIHVPHNNVANLKRQNHWRTANAAEGQRRFFSTAINQILGYGSSWQGAPVEYRDDVLLLQIQGDNAFFNWHANCGCVLHFWISRDALAKFDFSEVEATLECD